MEKCAFHSKRSVGERTRPRMLFFAPRGKLAMIQSICVAVSRIFAGAFEAPGEGENEHKEGERFHRRGWNSVHKKSSRPGECEHEPEAAHAPFYSSRLSVRRP